MAALTVEGKEESLRPDVGEGNITNKKIYTLNEKMNPWKEKRRIRESLRPDVGEGRDD